MSAPAGTPRPPLWPPGLDLVGAELAVPLVDGRYVRAVDLDRAATAPCLVAVKEVVDALLPWYGAPSRGAGYKAWVTTEALEQARDEVAAFVGARPGDAVVFVRNTTEACNLLAHLVAGRAEVVVFELEHHANLLPWQRAGARLLPVPASPAALLDEVARVAAGPHRLPLLVAMTGVCNVTGEVLPLAEAARLVHQAEGARLFVDAAQLAPHRALDMAVTGIDYLALSGHKLYAPFGAGALVGARDWLEAGEPLLWGGGAVRAVSAARVSWKPAPERLEAGTPNVVGAVALGAACRALAAAGMARVEEAEVALSLELDRHLGQVPGLERLSMWGPEADHVGVACFNLRGMPHGLVAAALSAEHGIGVRHGRFCAHLLMRELLAFGDTGPGETADGPAGCQSVGQPGAVRASAGVGTTGDDVERLAAALTTLAVEGPHWVYRAEGAEGLFMPHPDPRPRDIWHPHGGPLISSSSAPAVSG